MTQKVIQYIQKRIILNLFSFPTIIGILFPTLSTMCALYFTQFEVRNVIKIPLKYSIICDCIGSKLCYISIGILSPFDVTNDSLDQYSLSCSLPLKCFHQIMGGKMSVLEQKLLISLNHDLTNKADHHHSDDITIPF